MQHYRLTAEETRVVELLCDDWRDVLRCTTIDQAMERACTPFSHAQRLRIAEFLLRDPQADALMRWHPTAYVLTNKEKLIAANFAFAARGCGTPEARRSPPGDIWSRGRSCAAGIRDPDLAGFPGKDDRWVSSRPRLRSLPCRTRMLPRSDASRAERALQYQLRSGLLHS